MCKLDYNTWIRFGIWMAVGIQSKCHFIDSATYFNTVFCYRFPYVLWIWYVEQL